MPTTQTTERLVLGALLLLLVVLPLPEASNRPMYWSGSAVVVTLLLCLWLATVSLENFMRRLRPIRWPLALFALICLWVALQTIQTGPFETLDRHATASQLLKSLSLTLLMVLVAVTVTGRQRLRYVMWALVVSGTLQATIGILDATATGKSATGMFVNCNHLAGYLSMALAIGIGLLMADLHRTPAANWRHFYRRVIDAFLGPKAPIRICLVIMVIGLILTHSRMGNTAFFSAMTVSALFGLIIYRKSTAGVLLLFGSMLVIDVILMGTYFGIDRLRERIEATRYDREERSVTNRQASALLADVMADFRPKPVVGADEAEPRRVAAARGRAPIDPGARLVADPPSDISIQRALWGHGLGTYYSFFVNSRDRNKALSSIHAHNDYLEFGLELGALGAGMLALVFGSSMFIAIRTQMTSRSRLASGACFGVLFAGVSLAIHSTTDFNLQIYGNAATFVLILALPYLVGGLNDNQAGAGQQVR